VTSLLPRPILVALNKGDRAAAGPAAQSRVLSNQPPDDLQVGGGDGPPPVLQFRFHPAHGGRYETGT